MIYIAKDIRRVGIVQIVIGVLMILLGIAKLAYVSHWTSYLALGFWVGILVLVTGLTAVLGAKSDAAPNQCLISAMLGFGIASWVMTFVLAIIHGVFAAKVMEETTICGQHINDLTSCDTAYRYGNLIGSPAKVGYGMGVALTVLACVEFFVALSSWIKAYRACGCSCPRNAQVPGAYTELQPGNVATPSQIITLYPAPAGFSSQQNNTEQAGKMYLYYPSREQQHPLPGPQHTHLQTQHQRTEEQQLLPEQQPTAPSQENIQDPPYGDSPPAYSTVTGQL